MTGRVGIVGGGIAGLVAATVAARAGARVSLFEAVSAVGGRARTREESGFLFNMGAHALYNGGLADEVLAELGIVVDGANPPLQGALARREGRLHALPGGPTSLLSTGLIGARDKLALAALMPRLQRLDPASHAGRTLDEVLEQQVSRPRLREIVRALVRLTSYAHCPDRISGDAAIAQVQAGLSKGVRYPHGGWQAMVDALAAAVRGAGVELRTAVRVRSVEPRERGVALGLGAAAAEPFDAVVLALGPAEASALVASGSDPVLAAFAAQAVPARAASLDVGLDRLPDPRRRFALGMDEATYFSVHQPGARLGPAHGAVIHVMRYLAPDEKPERAELETQFEGLLDQMQPGWRDRLVTKRLLTDVPVVPALPTARTGGLPGRPKVALAHLPHVYLAGDWVGAEGMLVDASFASGRAAGRAAAGAAG